MEQAWKNRSKDPSYNAKLVHAKDAHNARCWIYSIATKKVYTPREFMESGEKVTIYRGKEDEAQFKIVDPRKILSNLLAEIQDKNALAADLHKRIFEYYDVQPKPKNNSNQS